MDSIEAFAPATVANLGPGFDVLGLAIAGRGDRVIARRAEGPLRIQSSNDPALPLGVASNTAGIAAAAVVQAAGEDPTRVGITLELHKGLPIGSGLGSSAASAVAAAVAVNALLGEPLTRAELLDPCLAAETVVSGRHADNVAPALFGGLVLVRRLDPLDWVRLALPTRGQLVIVSPAFELTTRAARAALSRQVALPDAVHNAADLAALVAAGYRDDLAAFAAAMNDTIATPARLPLIPGGEAALAAARDAGALAAGICGAGPSLFALVEADAPSVAAAMCSAFAAADLTATHHVTPLTAPGAVLR